MGLLWLCFLFFLFCLGPSLCLPLVVCRGAFACAGPLAGVPVGLKWGLCCLLGCFVPLLGFFIMAGPLQCAGPLGVLDWVTMWPCWFCGFGGRSAPLCLGFLVAWLLGVDMTAAVAPFFTLFLLNFIKSPPLSTDRDTGMHMISIPMDTFLFTESPSLSTDKDMGIHMISLPMVTVQHDFSLVLSSRFYILPGFCLPVD